MNKERMYCSVTKDTANSILKFAEQVNLEIDNPYWNDKKNEMFLTMIGTKMSLQTKIEMHPGTNYVLISPDEMRKKVSKHMASRKQFEHGICNSCRQSILWITDPTDKKKLPVNSLNTRVFTKGPDGKPIRITEPLYIDHNYNRPDCRANFNKKKV